MRFPGSLTPLVLLVASTCVTGCRRQIGYPDRPLVLLCPWAQGGGTDRVSRQIGAYLEKEIGVPVNVINATGGEGVTGHRRGALARPDGYTLLMMTVEINMLHHRKMTRLTWKNYRPLVLVNRDAAALFVRTDAPWKNVAELTEEIRRNPGKLTASGTATGGIWHLAAAGWLTSVGLKPGDIRWIPMGGAGPSLKDLSPEGVGALAMVCCSLPEARSMLHSGLIRCLGVMSDTPAPGYEDVPTFKSQGIDWSLGGWRGLGLPLETPDEVVDVLLPALRRIMKGETLITVSGERPADGSEGDRQMRFIDFMNREGYDASWEEPAAFRETLRKTDEELGKLLTRQEFASLSVHPIPPMTFPVALFSILGIVLVALLVERLRGSGGGRTASAAPVPLRAFVRFGEIVLAGVLYILLAETLGFILTAAPILFYLLWKLGTRAWVSLSITVVLVPLVYQLFAILLRVNLPHGYLGW